MKLNDLSIFILIFTLFSLTSLTSISTLKDLEKVLSFNNETLISKSFSYDEKESSYVIVGKSITDNTFFLAKADSQLNLKWKRTIGKSLTMNLPSVVINQDDGSIFVTSSFKKPKIDFDDDVLVVKFSKEGEKIWVTSLGKGYHHNGNGSAIAIRRKDNSIYTVYNEFKAYSSMVVVRLNSKTGDVLEKDKSKVEGEGYKYSSVLVNEYDDSINILGEFVKSNNQVDVFIKKYMPDLVFDKQRNFKSALKFQNSHCFTVDSTDGSVYFSSFSYQKSKTNVYNTLLVKVNLNLDVIWNNEFNNQSQEYITSIAVDDDKSIVVLGGIDDKDKNEMFLLRMSWFDGKVLQRKQFRLAEFNLPSICLVNKEKEVVVSGTYSTTEDLKTYPLFDSSVFIGKIKLDSI